MTIAYGGTAVGSQALRANTTGTYNTAVGNDALLANTTGTLNVVLGAQAFVTATTSSRQTAIGYGALNAMITNSFNDTEGNVALGYNAGTALTYGGANILLGYQAGDALTTGSNNLILGYDIDAPSATGNNQLNFGNIIFGSNVNSTGTTVDTDALIGIGTSTPWGKLSVTNTGSGPSFVVEDDTSPDSTPFIIDASGNVGIGTAAPVTPIDLRNNGTNVFGNFNSTALFRKADATTGINIGYNTSDSSGVLSTSGGGDLAFWTNPSSWSEAMRLTSAGKLGIGTTSPATTLSVAGSGYLTGGLGVGLLNTTAGTLQTSGLITGGTTLALSGTTGTTTLASGQGFTIGGSQFVLQQGSGNVGIGTAVPLGKGHVVVSSSDGTGSTWGSGQFVVGQAANAGALGLSYDSSNNVGYISSLSPAVSWNDMGFRGKDFIFINGNAERMRLTAGGSLGIGTTSPNHILTVSNATGPQLALTDGSLTSNQWTMRNAGGILYIATSTYSATSSISAMSLNANGSLSINNLVSCAGVQTNANGLMTCTSDTNLKDIHKPFTTGLFAIQQINPQTWSYKQGTESYDGVNYSSFIAQDVQVAIPEAVSPGYGGWLQINMNTVMASAVNAIKEIASISGVFKANLIAWLGDAGNGIGDLFARRGHFSEQLCVGATCVNEQQLAALLATAGQAASIGLPAMPAHAGRAGGSGSEPAPSQSSTDQATSSPPVTSIISPATQELATTTPKIGTTSETPTTSDPTLPSTTESSTNTDMVEVPATIMEVDSTNGIE
ncbi:MAG: tail fiber domain-containing protein [Patescibacteria group bacterium]